MRTRLKVGLLAAMLACVAFAAAKAQEEKSYLPPKSFQEKRVTTVPNMRAPRMAHAKIVRRAHVRTYAWKTRVAAVHHHRRTRLVYHRFDYPQRYAFYRPRYAYYQPAFPGFLFGFLPLY